MAYERRSAAADEFKERVVSINPVSKTVKGGRVRKFAVLVVVGDGKGKVGYGMGKANEVPEAIDKASAQAKKSMRKVALVGSTISHETVGKFGRGSIVMLPAEEGTGVIAGGPVRAVMEAAGVKNIRTKSHGTTNPINMVKAALEGLYSLKSVEEVAALRGKTVEEIMG